MKQLQYALAAVLACNLGSRLLGVSICQTEGSERAILALFCDWVGFELSKCQPAWEEQQLDGEILAGCWNFMEVCVGGCCERACVDVASHKHGCAHVCAVSVSCPCCAT